MDRVKSIFNHIFSLPGTQEAHGANDGLSLSRSKPKPDPRYKLQHLSVENKGMFASRNFLKRMNVKAGPPSALSEKKKTDLICVRSVELHAFMMISM